MKQKLFAFCAAALIFAACNNEKKEDGNKDKSGTTSVSEETNKEEPWVPVDSATMMAKMMEYGTPGPMHTMMASWNGNWNTESTMWQYEGAQPEKSNGTAVNSMIMGGKYQNSKYSGNTGYEGGKWVDQGKGKWAFEATPHNFLFRSREALQRYMSQHEPDTTLVIPK